MSGTDAVPFREAMKVWARVAALSFGGPAGQIAVMHRIIVEEKRWIGDQRFLQALNYCTLLPGPEAQQLATYIGWLMHRTKGGVVAGGLFVLPGLVAIMALSWIYVLLGRVPAVQGLFFGLKAAVLVIVVEAVLRVGKRALANNVMRSLAAGAFLAIFLYDVPFPIIIVAAGIIGWAGESLGIKAFAPGGGHGRGGGKLLADADSLLGEETPAHARPTLGWGLGIGGVLLALWLLPVAALALWCGIDATATQVALFFSKMAVVTFGGAYAVLAYVAQQAVDTFHWVRPQEMLDGLGMAESTPGPLIMVTQFVGFLALWRDPGSLPPLVAATLGGLRAVLPVDLRRRPVRRSAARQQGAGGGPGRDHRGGGRRDPEPRGLVRPARPVRHAFADPHRRCHAAGARALDRRSAVPGDRHGGCHRHLPVQGRHDPGVAGQRRSRHRLHAGGLISPIPAASLVATDEGETP